MNRLTKQYMAYSMKLNHIEIAFAIRRKYQIPLTKSACYYN